MKKLIILILLVPCMAFAGNIQDKHKSVIARQGASGGDSYLIQETFDGCTGTAENGCDNVTCGSAPCLYYSVARCDYTDSSSPLEGAQDCACGGAIEIAWLDFAPTSEVWVTAIIDMTDVTATTDRITIKDASNNVLANFVLIGSSMYVYNTGGTTRSDTENFVNGTKYYIKIRLKAGTGANAEVQGWASTDGTNWTFTTPVLSNDGTWTASPGRIALYGSTVAMTTRYDDVRVSASDIDY